MPSLLELQESGRCALLAGLDAPGAAPMLAAIADDDGFAAERLAIHRNNVFASLANALAKGFPVVRTLVDERFFAYAAHAFIQRHPPPRACLAEFGGRFPDFLAAFPACRELEYLADVARLEWRLHEAAHAPIAEPLAPAALRAVAAADTSRLTFRLCASLRYLASRWPVDAIWRANRAGSTDGAAIDLAGGGVQLEIRRTAGDVEMRVLPADVFAFRHALSSGLTLGTAAEAGLIVNPGFGLAAALSDLFSDRAVVRLALTEDMP